MRNLYTYLMELPAYIECMSRSFHFIDSHGLQLCLQSICNQKPSVRVCVCVCWSNRFSGFWLYFQLDLLLLDDFDVYDSIYSVYALHVHKMFLSDSSIDGSNI